MIPFFFLRKPKVHLIAAVFQLASFSCYQLLPCMCLLFLQSKLPCNFPMCINIKLMRQTWCIFAPISRWLCSKHTLTCQVWKPDSCMQTTGKKNRWCMTH
jgi:hypothetical protein